MSAAFDALGVQRFGTGTLASGVIRNTYGSGDEDGLAAFLAGRGLQPLQKKDGAEILCRKLCETLVCRGLKGRAKRICMRLCNATCEDLSPGVRDAAPLYRLCASKDISAGCLECCQSMCPIYYPNPGGMQGICINHCQKGCKP